MNYQSNTKEYEVANFIYNGFAVQRKKDLPKQNIKVDTNGLAEVLFGVASNS